MVEYYKFVLYREEMTHIWLISINLFNLYIKNKLKEMTLIWLILRYLPDLAFFLWSEGYQIWFQNIAPVVISIHALDTHSNDCTHNKLTLL